MVKVFHREIGFQRNDVYLQSSFSEWWWSAGERGHDGHDGDIWTRMTGRTFRIGQSGTDSLTLVYFLLFLFPFLDYYTYFCVRNPSLKRDWTCKWRNTNTPMERGWGLRRNGMKRGILFRTLRNNTCNCKCIIKIERPAGLENVHGRWDVLRCCRFAMKEAPSMRIFHWGSADALTTIVRQCDRWDVYPI